MLEATEPIFLQHSNLTGPIREVEGPCEIFDEYKMPKDSKILDLSCGIGRHSIPLAKRGFKVVGYDICPLYYRKQENGPKEKG